MKKNKVDWKSIFEILLNEPNDEIREEKKPKKRKDANKKPYVFCKYLDAGMEGMKCNLWQGDKNHNCLHCDGYECMFYKPKN